MAIMVYFRCILAKIQTNQFSDLNSREWFANLQTSVFYMVHGLKILNKSYLEKPEDRDYYKK